MLDECFCCVEGFEAFAEGFEGLWLEHLLKGRVKVVLSGGVELVIYRCDGA